jgi:hypothetical protein
MQPAELFAVLTVTLMKTEIFCDVIAMERQESCGCVEVDQVRFGKEVI